MTAVHVHPTVRWSTVAVDEGPVNASPDHVRVVVEGAAGHAAYPHEARNPSSRSARSWCRCSRW
jgi:metal-dependent amidase/aminoacylase/carboxypeptidase family protein